MYCCYIQQTWIFFYWIQELEKQLIFLMEMAIPGILITHQTISTGLTVQQFQGIYQLCHFYFCILTVSCRIDKY